MKKNKEQKAENRALKVVYILFIFLASINGLHAQSEVLSANPEGVKLPILFPAGDFWALNVGLGMSGIMVDGMSFQLVLDPRLWLSPALMVGAKAGLNYSAENHTEQNVLGNIFTLEGQVYLRWNFLRFGRKQLTNIFLQGGIGLIAAYRGKEQFIDLNDVKQTRGSVLADAALGITIPISPRWNIEPSIRGGYPHIWGVSLTTGYKVPLPHKTTTITNTTTEYIETVRETIKMLPPSELIKIIKITAIEFILFGPDIGRYNRGIDNDAKQLNELVLNYTVQTLKENPDYHVRIEGHANPYTISMSEAEDLMTLSSMRANTIAEMLLDRGVKEEQIVVIGFGGTRAATSEWDIRNRNRRVELMIIQIDNN